MKRTLTKNLGLDDNRRRKLDKARLSGEECESIYMLCTNGTHGNAGEIATLIDTIQRQFIKVEEFTHIIYIYIYIYIYSSDYRSPTFVLLSARYRLI